MTEDPLEKRLRDAERAVRDDIRGVFKAAPEYQHYLASLLREAANAIHRS